MGQALVPAAAPGRPRDDAGAAAVEFALVLPLLLVFLFGTFVTGWTLWERQGANATAQSAARLAAYGLSDQQYSAFPGNVAGLAACNGVGRQLTTIGLHYSKDAAGTQSLDPASPDPQFVTVTLTWHSALAGLPLYVPVVADFSTRATLVMEALGEHHDDVTVDAPQGVECS